MLPAAQRQESRYELWIRGQSWISVFMDSVFVTFLPFLLISCYVLISAILTFTYGPVNISFLNYRAGIMIKMLQYDVLNTYGLVPQSNDKSVTAEMNAQGSANALIRV